MTPTKTRCRLCGTPIIKREEDDALCNTCSERKESISIKIEKFIEKLNSIKRIFKHEKK